MKIHIICVAYERYVQLEILIRSFILQSNPNWMLYIIYDGPVPAEINSIINPLLIDTRIVFYNSPVRNQHYGHPNRSSMLETIETEPGDFILMTNDDNYYIPRFIEFFLAVVDRHVGIIYCNTIHSHLDYRIQISELVENGIDMGAFAVRADIAKQTGFNYNCFSADGKYAGECLITCKANGLKAVKINKCLFIHN